MQVTDAVKLLYQSEFGGGHMIANPEKSLSWICAERDAGDKKDASIPVLEEIGGGICRIGLHALDLGLAPETLNRMFVKTADRTVGSVEGFERKLELLRDLCREGRMPFAMEELECYLSEYKKQGYPPVSHSDRYREAYRPSYRVVSSAFTRYYGVFLAIDRALAAAGDRQVTVAIDGMCGSGKSTLGRVLEEFYDCNLLYMDDFFLRPEQRTPERLAEPGGNVDYERFREEILDHIADEDGFEYQLFNCGKMALDGVRKLPYKQLNIIEGSYSHHPYFGDPYDLRFFCRIGSEEQQNRILKRNGPEMLERFKQIWIPMENRYFEAFDIEAKSQIV